MAVCDLGTFSALILIARWSNRGWCTVFEERHTIDLLANASRGKSISARSVTLLADILRRFQALADSADCDDGAVVCTAAFRNASNRLTVVKRLRQSTEFPVRILTARDEALCSMAGARIGLRHGRRFRSMIDVGGGSLEVVRMVKGRPTMNGINCGAARATAEWRDKQPHRRADREDYFRERAKRALGRLPAVSSEAPLPILGVGGTIVALAGIAANLDRFEPHLLHGRVLTRRWIAKQASVLSLMSQKDIAGLIRFDPRRARVLTAGTFLWSAVLDRYDADRVTVSVRGLRWGIAARLAGQQVV